MAAKTKTTFTIYHEQFHSGYTETLVQETEAFNAASQNAIRLSTESKIGDYANETFFSSISSLVSRRDTSSVSAATDLDLVNAEISEVKLNRKIGPDIRFGGAGIYGGVLGARVNGDLITYIGQAEFLVLTLKTSGLRDNRFPVFTPLVINRFENRKER